MPESLPDFVDARQAAWDDLADLVDRARGRIGQLEATSVRLLGRRYRQAAADLAQARRRFPRDHDRAGLASDVTRRRRRNEGMVRTRRWVGRSRRGGLTTAHTR